MARLTFLSGPRKGEQFEIDDEATLGREGADVAIDDREVSRVHARVVATEDGLEVSDLGSTNGTWVDGRRISGPTVLPPRAKLRVGTSEIEVTRAVSDATRLRVHTPPQTPALEALPAEGSVIRFARGTQGALAAPEVAARASSARTRLGIEAPGVTPQIYLVDPFPDPADPDRTVAHGSVVDPGAGEIWMVVTAESPPEAPERPLALVLGASLPAGPQLEPLLEGWGLHVAGAPDPSAWLDAGGLPRIAAAEGDLRAAMTVSFVRFLIAEAGEEAFLRFLTTTQPGQLEDGAHEAFGYELGALEDRWRAALAGESPPVKTGQFLRLTARYLRPYAGRQAEVFVWMLLGLAFTVVFPFAFRALLDDAIPSGRFSEVAVILALLGAAFLVTLIAGLRRSYLNAWLSSAVIRDIRTQMFTRLQALEPGWFHRHQAGDVLTRLFNDVEGLEVGLSQALREGAFQLMSLIVAGIVLVILNPILGAIVLLGAPAVALVYRLMAAEGQRRSLRAQDQFGELSSVAHESYGGQPVVKAFALEAREVARFGRASDRLFKSEVSLELFGGFFTITVELVVTVLRIAVLALGAYLIFEGELTIGGLVAFTALMGEVLAPVTVLTGIGQQVQQASGSLVRINEILDSLPEIADPPDAGELGPLGREIELRDVSFSYTPERRTLEGVTATIPAGSRVAFVGPSGAGKSSVLGLLMRFHDPDEGAVLFDGRDIRSVTLGSLRAQLGVVFQDTFLFNATVRENIALGRAGASDEQIEAAARAARLDEFVDALPDGYATVIGERGNQLSGGQRQRLAIARALVRDPSVLLLDEATSALDPRTESLIAETIDSASEGRTTISVTHRLTSITHYDRIFVIADGRLVEQGTHDDLVALGGEYATLWAEQTGAVVPARSTLDIATALGRLPLFARLEPDELEEVKGRLRALDLAPGQTLQEGGRLLLVRSGRARALAQGPRGERLPQAELGPGDSFGLGALLGDSSDVELEADGPVQLLALAEADLAGFAARFPSVADALAGRAAVAAAPAGGRRLETASRVLSRPVLQATGRGRDSGGVQRGIDERVIERASRAANRLSVGP